MSLLMELWAQYAPNRTWYHPNAINHSREVSNGVDADGVGLKFLLCSELLCWPLVRRTRGKRSETKKNKVRGKNAKKFWNEKKTKEQWEQKKRPFLPTPSTASQHKPPKWEFQDMEEHLPIGLRKWTQKTISSSFAFALSVPQNEPF